MEKGVLLYWIVSYDREKKETKKREIKISDGPCPKLWEQQ